MRAARLGADGTFQCNRRLVAFSPMSSNAMTSQHLYLTGYRGCGKSTLAKLLAQSIGIPSVDLDDVIESTAGKSIKQIFAEETEVGFRDREELALVEVSQRTPHVVALGGGSILRPSNREKIAATGWCVWLDAKPETLVRRLAGDSTTSDRRPALTDQSVLDEVSQVMAQRESLYRDASDLRIDTTDRTMQSIADEVLAAWGQR